MSNGTTPSDSAAPNAAHEHLARVLSSRTLAQAGRLRRFLDYIARASLAGQKGRLNQYAIAMAVFDRDETFDPAIDAIVRVEAGRLRSKLLEYYDDEGKYDPMRLALAKRGYAVRFSVADPPAVPNAGPTAPPTGPALFELPGVADPTLAVLPFDNMSPNPAEDYLSDGIAEDLITDLSRLPGLSVISRQSAFAYKGTATDAREVSAALGADFIVEGSVRKVGRRIRINAQLIQGETGKHIWAERFDREFDDIFKLLDSVNRKIVDALRLQISTFRESHTRHQGTARLEAYDYLLRGMSETRKRTRDGSTRAKYCFEAALELDPRYPDAYARLCLNVIYDWIAGWNNRLEETIDRAETYALKALELDAQNALAYAALSWVRVWQGDHDAAIAAGDQALDTDPNNVTALEYLALALAWSRRADQGLEKLARAKFLNPLDGYHFPTGVCHFMQGRHEEAVEELRHITNASPTFLPAWLYLAACLAILGRSSELRPAVDRIRELDPNYDPVAIRPTTFKFGEDRMRFVGALEAALST